MRNHRWAAALTIPVAIPVLTALAIPSQDTERHHKWLQPGEPQRTMILSSENLKPLADFTAAYTAWLATQAQAQAQTAEVPAAPTPSAVSTPPATTTTTVPATSGGSDAGWNQVAICEEGGRNDPTYGYFGIYTSTWAAYGGTAYSPTAGGSSWATQVMIGDKINGGPPWAPAGCAAAGYRGW